MTTRSKWNYQGLRYYDDVTQESILPVRSHVLYDDFDGYDFVAGAISARWHKKLVQTAGSPSVGALANAAGGVVSAALDATSEKQDAAFYFGDQLTFDVSKGFNYEARVQLGVIPTGVAQVVIGMGSAWIDGPDNQAHYLRFGLRANGTLLCEIQDGVNQVSVSSGITIATTTEEHILKIVAENTAGVQFFVDGNIVAESTTFAFAATGSNAILQPYSSVYKASGTGVATLNLDVIRAWGNRV